MSGEVRSASLIKQPSPFFINVNVDNSGSPHILRKSAAYKTRIKMNKQNKKIQKKQLT